MKPIIRKQIWQGLLSTERLARYFTQLHRQYYRRHMFYNVVLTASSTSLVGGFAFQLDWPIVQTTLSATIGIIAIIYLAQNPSKQVASLHVINTQMNRYCREYNDLWLQYELYKIDDDEALNRSNRVVKITEKIADQFDLPPNEKLNQKAAQEAYEFVLSRYSHAT